MAAVPLAGFPPTSFLPLSLLNLHIICWEEAEPAVAFSYPPTLVNLDSTMDIMDKKGQDTDFGGHENYIENFGK